jgi:SAM-dependent methyltransferase
MTPTSEQTPTATNGPSPLSAGLPGAGRRGDKPRRVKCQICGADTVPGLDLGHQPVGDLILSPAQLNQPETFYPMRLQHCHDCGLTQLSYTVNPKVVYKNFPFVSGTTQTTTKHLQSLPARLVEMLGLDERSFAIDVGSNDGTLLKGYLPHGVRFLGVDPSGDPVRIANEQGIETLHAFFDESTAEHIHDTYGGAEAITACGCFAHIADLTGVMRGAQRLLKKGGVFAIDVQYWLDMVQTGHYDNIFHQHLRYYAMRPLIHLFEQYGMEIFDVERSEVYGGQIRVFVGHRGDHPRAPSVDDLVALEESERLYEESTNVDFARKIEERRARLFGEVYERVSSGKKVIGVGAPAKASTVANYCRLGPDLVEYVTEVNPLRIGKYLPGAHIPIVDEQLMFDDPEPADAAILFAWNYYDEIVPKLRSGGYEGEFLQP